jgi:hypothetical protein
MGVPAVGMAFPGYVPGKSEMTWYRYILWVILLFKIEKS